MTDPYKPAPDEPEPSEPAASDPAPAGPRPDHPILEAGKFASDQTAASVIAYLITGPAVFGGLGLLLDRWLGTGFFVLLGLLAGMAMSLYIIWLRYGTQ